MKMKMKRKASLLRASPQRLQASEFQPNNDSSCRKRIKVRDLNSDTPLTCKRDTSLIRAVPLTERHVTNPNNAKTSEFAFFKKFKEDATLRFSSSLPRQKELQPKMFNPRGCSRERISPVKNCCKDFTSHFLVENVTPVNFDSMSSPLGNSSKISEEIDVKQAHETLDIQRKQRSMENDDIFSRKRQKLRQFIQSMSFYGTGESYEKGSGGVSSMLLCRLLPESNQYWFDNNSEKLQWFPGSCSSRLDHEHHLNKSRRRVFSHSDCSTNSNDKEFLVKYRNNESDCELEGTITLLDANSSLFTAAVADYKSLISRQFNLRYGLYDHGEPLQLIKQEPEALLLGWGIDNIKDESAFSSQLTELNEFAEPPTSFADDHQPNLYERSGAAALCSSPFPSSNHGNLYSFPYSSLASYQIHGSSRQENTDAAFNNLHLNFSYVPKCLTECDNHTNYDGSSDFFCAQSAHWLTSNVLDEEPQHPSIESLRASGFVFDLGWKYLSGSEEHCQTAYHILEFPVDEMRPTVPIHEDCDYGSSNDAFGEYRLPFLIQPKEFFQERKVCSLLTDKSNVDITEMDCIWLD